MLHGTCYSVRLYDEAIMFVYIDGAIMKPLCYMERATAFVCIDEAIVLYGTCNSVRLIYR